MNVKIVIRKDKKNAHGLCPVVIQISEGKEVARIPLGFTINEEDFDQKTQTVLKQHSAHKNYNQNIQNAKDKIERINKEVSQLGDVNYVIGLPNVSAFKELYNAEEGNIESVLTKYAEEYGGQKEQLIYPFRNPRQFRIPINYTIQPEKFDEAMTLLRKFSKGEPDPKIDELLARQEKEEAHDEQDEREASFLEAWDKYYKHCLQEKAASTSIRIPNNLAILKSFSTFSQIPLTFESFTEDFGSELKYYLIKEHKNYITDAKGVSNGTVHNIQKSIAAFLNWAFKKGFNKSIEFKKWKSKKPQTDLQYLTEPQLKQLRNFKLPKGGSYDKTRDLWLFSAYSGMRCGDIQKWIPSYVSSEGVIKYKSEKTKKNCAVGLNDVTRSILKKYRGNLPKQNSALINKNIKDILRKMKYDKIMVNRVVSVGTEDTTHVMPLCDAITMHSAKRSFINLMISKNTQIAHLGTMIGNDVKSLMVYYKDDTSQIKKVMDGIDFA